MLWLVFQPPKGQKKYKKFPNRSKNNRHFFWNPLNLQPIWIHKSGQEKNNQNLNTKKSWSLKRKFAVWCSGVSPASTTSVAYCHWVSTTSATQSMEGLPSTKSLPKLNYTDRPIEKQFIPNHLPQPPPLQISAQCSLDEQLLPSPSFSLPADKHAILSKKLQRPKRDKLQSQ